MLLIESLPCYSFFTCYVCLKFVCFLFLCLSGRWKENCGCSSSNTMQWMRLSRVSCIAIQKEWMFTMFSSSQVLHTLHCFIYSYSYSRSEVTEWFPIRRLFLLKERSDGGGTISRLFECMSVRNKRRRQYHQIVTKFLFKKNRKKYLESNCNFWPEPN